MDLSTTTVHDIELFPNLFTDIFKAPQDDTLYIQIIHEDTIPDSIYQNIRRELSDYQIEFFPTLHEMFSYIASRDLFIGYNSFEYDDCLLNWIFRNYQSFSSNAELLGALWNVGRTIMDDNWEYKRNSIVRTCDLMRVGNVKAIYKPLKQIAGNIRWTNIQEYSLHFGKPASLDQIPDILLYELNDILITERLMLGIHDSTEKDLLPESSSDGLLPAIELRESLGQLYNVDIINETDSGMGNILNNELYSRSSDLPFSKFKNLRTGYNRLHYSDIIFDDISYDTQELQDFLSELKQLEIDVSSMSIGELYEIDTSQFRALAKEKLTFERTFCELPVTFGVGGLHSNQDPQIFAEDELHYFLDADVSSYYPSLMLENNIFPKHLGEAFLTYYQQIVDERLEGKRTGDKLKASAMKILVNAVFGKLNFPDYWLCDLKALLSVTLNGQLWLLKLIEMLYLKGIVTKYANTDGISVYVPKDKLEEYYSICGKDISLDDSSSNHIDGEWEEVTQLSLETTNFSKMFHRDCNNYIVVTTSGKVKAKGAYDWKLYLERYGAFNVASSFKCPIVPYAVEQYFVHNIPIEKIIYSHESILDFCICGKIGRQFVPILVDAVTGSIERQQQSIRYYISNSSKKLFKRKTIVQEDLGGFFPETSLETYRDTDVSVGRNITILNKYIEYKNFSEYDIDYSYYMKECQKLIKDIEGVEEVQLSFFSDTMLSSISQERKPVTQYTPPPKSLVEKYVSNNEIHVSLPEDVQYVLFARLSSFLSIVEGGDVVCHVHIGTGCIVIREFPIRVSEDTIKELLLLQGVTVQAV